MYIRGRWPGFSRSNKYTAHLRVVSVGSVLKKETEGGRGEWRVSNKEEANIKDTLDAICPRMV
jgi:hypothetical protein